MRRISLIGLVAALAATALAWHAPTPAAAKAVTGATLLVGRGFDVQPQAVRLRLGTTRRAVVKALGKPLARNEFGYLGYARKRDGVFDLFVNQQRERVDLIVASLPGLCTPHGVCLFQPGALGQLMEEFGAGLARVTESGGIVYRVRSRLDGRLVFTDFQADGDGPEAQLVSVSLFLQLG